MQFGAKYGRTKGLAGKDVSISFRHPSRDLCMMIEKESEKDAKCTCPYVQLVRSSALHTHWGSACTVGAAENEDPRLISREVIFKVYFPSYVTTITYTSRTDGHLCYSNTSACIACYILSILCW